MNVYMTTGDEKTDVTSKVMQSMPPYKSPEEDMEAALLKCGLTPENIATVLAKYKGFNP